MRIIKISSGSNAGSLSKKKFSNKKSESQTITNRVQKGPCTATGPVVPAGNFRCRGGAGLWCRQACFSLWVVGTRCRVAGLFRPTLVCRMSSRHARPTRLAEALLRLEVHLASKLHRTRCVRRMRLRHDFGTERTARPDIG